MSDIIATFAEQLETGLFPDVKGRASPFWIDGRNIFFDDRGLQGGLGQYLLFTPTQISEVLGIHTASINGVPTLFFNTATKAWQWTTSGGLVEITNGSGDYTGTSDNLWSFGSWGDWVGATNGVDTPQLFKSSAFADMGGLGTITRAELFAERSPFGVLLNTNIYDKDLAWCDDDDVEDWVPTNTNFAGSLTARGLDSGIKNVKKLGTEIVFYSINEMRTLGFIGAPLAFGIQPRLKDIGTVGKAAVADIGGVHYGFGPRGIWRTDGTQSEYISQGIIQKYIYNNVNRAKWHKVVAWHNSAQSVVTFFMPFGTSSVNNRGVGYNYKNNSWTLMNYGRSAAHDSGVFDYALVGDAYGNIWAQGVQDAPPVLDDNNVVSVADVGASYSGGYGAFGYGQGGYGGGSTDADG